MSQTCQEFTAEPLLPFVRLLKIRCKKSYKRRLLHNCCVSEYFKVLAMPDLAIR